MTPKPRTDPRPAGVGNAPSLDSRSDSTVGAVTRTAQAIPDSPVFGLPASAGEVGRLGKYRIQKELGRGGMGAVFLAFDERLHRKVALKVMLPAAAANPTAKDRFLREARSAAQIDSEYVVKIHDADEIDGVPFIALQYLQGYPLDEYLKKKGLPSLPQTVRVARETALGLAAAHKLGLVHRDIKPANVWLEAPSGRVKILDFGLAKPLQGPERTDLTAHGVILGTPAYMAPEQSMGQPLDGRADLFSLGCLLYRMVTGRLPFDRPTLVGLLTAIATEEPTPVQQINPLVPPDLATLIHRLLAKKPDQRPATAKEVADELDRIAHPPKPAVSPDAPTMQPLAVFVPIAVTAEQPNPFADLYDEDSPAERSGGEVTPEPESNVSGKTKWLLPVAVGAGLLGLILLAVAGFIVIKITNKDGSVTEIKVPDDSKVEVDGKPVKPPDTKKADPKPTDPKPDKPGPKETPVPTGPEYGLAFDGKETHVEIPTLTRNDDGPITLEAWVTVSAVPRGANLMQVRGKYPCQVHSWQGKNAETDLVPNVGTNAGKLPGDQRPPLVVGRRAHVAGQIDREKIELFLDGKRVESVPLAAKENGDGVTGTVLGAFKDDKSGAVSWQFAGTVSEVRISKGLRYKDTFTPAARYEPDKDTLVLYHCDEGQGEELKDSSGNKHHGKITAGKWVIGFGDRRVAETLLPLGCAVMMRVDGQEKWLKGADGLGDKPFQVVNLNTNRNKNVNDDVFQCLRGLRSLTSAQLTNCDAGDKTLECLRDSTNLESLILYNSKVTDRGLETLAGFTRLKYLDITQLPGLSEKAVKQLAAKLPACRIRWNGGEIEPK